MRSLPEGRGSKEPAGVARGPSGALPIETETSEDSPVRVALQDSVPP